MGGAASRPKKFEFGRLIKPRSNTFYQNLLRIYRGGKKKGVKGEK